MGFLILLTIFVALFFSISTIVPLILSWFFERKYKIPIVIGRISLPYLKLCDIQIIRSNYLIQIKEVGIKSSFLNSELTKLITLVVKDVTIENAPLHNKKSQSKFMFAQTGPWDFREKKVPNFINSFAQFMAIHVYNISAPAIQLDNNCLLQILPKELHIDGSIFKNTKSLLVTLNISDAYVLVIKKSEKGSYKLAEFSFGISMETVLVAQGPLSVEKLDIKMSESKAVIGSGLYTWLKTPKGSVIHHECTKVINDIKEDTPTWVYKEGETVIFESKEFSELHATPECKNTPNTKEILDRIKPIVPKNFCLHIDHTQLEGYDDKGKTEYTSRLKGLSLNYSTVQQNDKNGALLNFCLNNFNVEMATEKIVELISFCADAKLKNNTLNIFMQQNNLLVTYNHQLISSWINKNFNHSSFSPGSTVFSPKLEKPNSILEQLTGHMSLNFDLEIFNVILVIKLDNQCSSVGFNKARLTLDQAQETRGKLTKYNSYLANLVLGKRHWESELLVESLWWSFKEWNHGTNISKVLHVWETPVYLGMGLVKCCTADNNVLKIYSLLDTVQLEWSLQLSEFLLLALKAFENYHYSRNENKSLDCSKNISSFLTTSLVITHCNFFLQTQNEEYFVTRLDTISIDTIHDNYTLKLEDLKLFTLNNTGDNYTCMRTEDILNYKIFMKIVHLNYSKKPEQHEFNISFLEDIVAYWSANFHLKTLLLIKDIENFGKKFIKLRPRIKKPEVEKLDMPVKVLNCICYGKLQFHIDINKEHDMTLVLEKAIISKNFHPNRSKQDTKNAISSVVVAIDGKDIFEIKGIDLKRIFEEDPAAEKLKAERQDASLKSIFNDFTCWLEIESFKVVFPYEHNYAEAIQNQLISMFKWLKIIHKNDEGPKAKSFPADWLINIKEFLLEMSDDPFEVKLRDNFELLEDEFSESLKRQKMLKEKIAELLKTHLHMPAGKVEELYATLKKKNADIYIQRSKLMYQAAPPRTRLFAWSMVNVESMVMAEIFAVDDKMKQLDNDSPWPEEKVEYSILWGRYLNLTCAEWKFLLRDFPQPWMEIRKLYLCGLMIGAEEASRWRAIRTVLVDLGEPFEPFEVERGMQPLKFYYDLNCEIESFSYAFGPCWEPVIAQCNLSFNQISAPSKDPSPPLPFWDKIRLLMHGRLTMVVQQMQVLLHASLDPYNTTEEMALVWDKVVMDWTNGKIVFKGDLNIFVRTASKYDDVQLLKLPNLKLILGFQWVCLSDPNDHHNVIYCAPNKIPEYSSNQVHDSFRAFRSQNLNLSIVLETKPSPSPSSNSCPTLLLYGSTLRWIESLKLILSGVTRPTKRGKIFDNVRSKKLQLSRHYKKINLLVGLHKFQVCYWMSFAMQRGCEMFGGRLCSSSEHSLNLVSIEDGLKHRAKAEWSVAYMCSELTNAEMWLKSALQDESEIETTRPPVEKTYCLSVAKVSYGRENVFDRNKDTPIHRLVVYDLRGAWTKSNRNVAFALFDTFMKTTRTKKNLSTEALKGFRKDTNTTPMKRRNADNSATPPNNTVQNIQSSSSVADTLSPISKIQSGHAANMLQQLIAEVDNNSIVYSDDLSAVSRQQHLQGVQACQEDDVLHKNWQISLVNAQVLLKGCETNGYVILSAAKAEILQRAHRPVWKDRTLVSKTTWTGLLECMQYYATVNAGENDENENIMWLTVDNIQEKESAEISEPSEVPNMVGSGVSVGAVVSDTVGPSSSRQLQRIVSRCKCEFFYAGYGNISVDPEGVGEIPPPPQEDVSPWDSRQSGVDAFTLMHYDLEVCTNSLQYAMLLDIINNLLLYVEPHRKEALEKLARMRFQLQLHTFDDQRKPIQEQQTVVRNSMNKLRRLEKDTYMINKALEEDPDDKELRMELERLERLMYDCKMNLNAQSEELDMMISCYKETQLLASARMATTRSDKPLTAVRANEICFKHAQWRLTEADGQIGIADLVLSNFLYTKNSKSDDSVEHLLELGYLRMTNLLPNEIYKEILCPTEIQYDMPIEHKKVLRIFCREKPPVGGISLKEHFEINLVPLTIGLTKKFYNTMMKFCFPERDTETAEYNDRASEDGDSDSKKKGKSKKSRDSNFYVHIDDVDKMKERAEKNKLFVFIKIPEVPVKVSYKGTKEKNLEDLRDVSIVIPTLEYHNMTWTWLDLLIAIRNDTKKVILSQAIKQKLQIKRNTGNSEDSSTPQEEDKAKMLLGSRHHKLRNFAEKAPENRSIRKGVSDVFKLGK
ncbi:protein KIAA0100 isoform X2 [Anthonomus grandis grandis]|uniref:protein KIAA0100 isoform X2 n=1 Tax=Anthonomus grandis grandis TaxID=2921223 RepID=UPI0021655DD6|nr:protein KIAA0100 isoform X2 [Anthonomus grandis grandis]